LNSVNEVIKLFFSLGLVAFGGPAAHIAMMHREVVEKRKWVSADHFLDLIAATSLIPGPNSTEMTLHCGYQRAGWRGLIAAGVSFILPATILTYILAVSYQKLAGIPQYYPYLFGIRPVVLILVLGAIIKLSKKAVKKRSYWLITFSTLALCFSSLGEIGGLFIGSLISFFVLKLLKNKALVSVEPLSLFFVFLKVGSVLFGSGYVLIAYLQDELIVKRSWLTLEQLSDAIAIGQLTPGPVLSTSTFVGYLLGGNLGALTTTVGIFLPSFFFVLFLNPMIPKMRASKNLSLLLDCVNAATIGLMIYALLILFQGLNGLPAYFILALVGVVFWKLPKVSSIKLVFLGFGLGALSLQLGLG